MRIIELPKETKQRILGENDSFPGKRLYDRLISKGYTSQGYSSQFLKFFSAHYVNLITIYPTEASRPEIAKGATNELTGKLGGTSNIKYIVKDLQHSMRYNPRNDNLNMIEVAATYALLDEKAAKSVAIICNNAETPAQKHFKQNTHSKNPRDDNPSLDTMLAREIDRAEQYVGDLVDVFLRALWRN